MNKEETKQAREVMQAFEGGAEIESKAERREGAWFYADDPCWDWVDYNYRIKPEPLVLWVNVIPGQEPQAYTREMRAVQELKFDVGRTIKMIEVIE